VVFFERVVFFAVTDLSGIGPVLTLERFATVLSAIPRFDVSGTGLSGVRAIFPLTLKQISTDTVPAILVYMSDFVVNDGLTC